MNYMKDLSPYLDYFEMLQSYVRQGYLEVFPPTMESYITIQALYTLAGVDMNDREAQQIRKISNVVRHLRTYTQYLNAYNAGYKQYVHEFEMAKDTPVNSTNVEQVFEARKKWPNDNSKLDPPFALHVVDYNPPHDLRFTVLLSSRRRWFWPFTTKDNYDVIEYNKREKIT